MGKKVNYNKKNKKLKLLLIIILCLLFLLILVKSLKDVVNSLPQNNEGTNTSDIAYREIKDYETLQDLLKSFDCKYIRQETQKEVEIIYLTFDVDLYTGSTSNETHFLNICKAVAKFLKYKDFELIDNSRSIDIEIKCDEPNIIQFMINGDLNYYLNHDSNSNRNLKESTTEFSIQSEELQALIDNDWDETKVNFGTKESTCDGYNIYFDEGIKYKNVARNIFNVVFTENYKGKVAAGLTTKASAGEVEKALGDPTFVNGDETLYGYIGENNYLFFNFSSNEISVYPVVSLTEDEEKDLKQLVAAMNDSSDIKTFASDLTTKWIDYDVYDFDSDYVDLRYTLKGVQLSIDMRSLKNGLFIYQNYSGNRNISDFENVYIQSTNLVFESESDRVLGDLMQRIEQGDFTEEELKEMGIDFSVRFVRTDGKYAIGPKFYSRDRSHADSELEKTLEISSYVWYGNEKQNYLFIYSVDDDGLYVYDCISRNNVKITDLEGEITLKYAENGKIVYNNDQVINVTFE